MGYYTAIYGKMKLKDDVAKEVVRKEGGSIIVPQWNLLKKVRRLRKHPDIRRFLSWPRSTSIATGKSAHHDLSDPEGLKMYESMYLIADLRGESDCSYDPKTRELRFFCSIKNNASTIEVFAGIAGLLADEGMLVCKGEDDEKETLLWTTYSKPRVSVHSTDFSSPPSLRGATYGFTTIDVDAFSV